MLCSVILSVEYQTEAQICEAHITFAANAIPEQIFSPHR